MALEDNFFQAQTENLAVKELLSSIMKNEILKASTFYQHKMI